ncbi:unnamed protein product [marine sediment metagenome]|uniref:Phage terminase small subunit P27 family n=1 Tax=marine sediment metagenome TaxID=412755 RepID=X0Y6A3_9ZZZZ
MKLLQGNPGGKPLPRDEPTPKSAAPSCPAHLKGEAAKEWKRITPLLLDLGLLGKIDRALLSQYCSAWSLFVRADREVETADLVMISDKGFPFQSPWVSIRRGAVEECVRIAGHFGMSPAARTRISVILEGDKPKSSKATDLDAILNG